MSEERSRPKRSQDFSDKVDSRLAVAEGQIKAIRKMLTEGKECVSIMTQLMAVERAIKKAGIMILKNHMDCCIHEAVINRDTQTVSELSKILEMYL